MWLARNKQGNLALYTEKPIKDESKGYWKSLSPHDYFFDFNDILFPDLNWEDEPIEVELVIKK